MDFIIITITSGSGFLSSERKMESYWSDWFCYISAHFRLHEVSGPSAKQQMQHTGTLDWLGASTPCSQLKSMFVFPCKSQAMQ